MDWFTFHRPALRNLYDMDFIVWDALKSNPDVLMAEGAALLTAFNADIEDLLKRKHVSTLCSHKGMACNAPPKYASELSSRLAQDSGTFGLVYSFDGTKGEWQCSIRSIGDFDVSKIARAYGGGGHKNASGFAVKHFEDIL